MGNEGCSIVFLVYSKLIILDEIKVYTWWANRKFDVLNQELLKELGHE